MEKQFNNFSAKDGKRLKFLVIDFCYKRKTQRASEFIGSTKHTK